MEDRLVNEQADQEMTLAGSEEFENRRKALASALSALTAESGRIFETRRLAEEKDHARGAGRGIRRLARSACARSR